MTFPGLEMTILKFHDFSRFSVTVRTPSQGPLDLAVSDASCLVSRPPAMALLMRPLPPFWIVDHAYYELFIHSVI